MISPASLLTCAASACAFLSITAADLPPDKGNVIPESGKRPVVVSGKATLALPKHDLPEGYTLSVAAASPLVTHPIMGCLDDKGRLFVGDGVGVNWNKAQLEANPPNRVLMLEDTDRDGVFDKSTVFADKMTFPQGGCWLNGSLYVCSPPGLWKLTDTDNDGVADKREMLVGGFEYTGNAADVHGPFLHPTNGRLYWCHGRKGHKVVGKDEEVVHEGLACGIWSCKPDGTQVQWHSLGCGDNPVEVDFTPEGDVIGVQNLYYSQPRGDTIIHWLFGGVYERADQLKAIEGLPRTLEHMPVMYNFGHVAVSGSTFWRGYRGQAGAPARKGGKAEAAPAALQFMVTHFNTQRVVRMELTPDGGTYKARENEFLKLHNPDVHFTDVMEDPRDGSLLVIDTGGWFRIGCPSSLMAKSDLLGAIYRVKPAKAAPVAVGKRKPAAPVMKALIAGISSKDALVRRRALEGILMLIKDNDSHEDSLTTINEKLMTLMSRQLDPATEHALIALANEAFTVSYQDVKENEKADPVTLRHLIQCFTADDSASANMTLNIAKDHIASSNADLARVALNYVIDHPDSDEWIVPDLAAWLKDAEVPALRLQALTALCTALITKPETQKLIGQMLGHASADVRKAALSVLAAQTSGVANDAWIAALQKTLAGGPPSPLLLDAIKKLKGGQFDAALQAIAADAKQPLAIRLKALDSAKGIKLTGETFLMVKGVLADASSSAAARIQAAAMLANAPLDQEQRKTVAPLLATAGPVELEKLLPLLRTSKDADMVRTFATELAKNPAIASQQESHYRTALADKPVDIFETIILPAYAKAVAATEAKKRLLPSLADSVVAKGDAAAGRKHFEAGKGTCIACHKIGATGRAIGPDLSKIGAIRTERDLLESILFPSNTLARDYEAHIIETSDGQSTMGVIKSHTAEGLLVIDIAGQEKTVPHIAITGDTTLTTSLMPMGLDQTLPEQELLDLVAWLRSLK